MATHHILKDGTSYAVSGGSDLVNGTKYQIGGGRTLIDGTVYEIGFAKKFTVTISGEIYTPQYGTKGYVKIAGTSVPVGEYQVEYGTEIEVRAGYTYQGRNNAVIALNGVIVTGGEGNFYRINVASDTKIEFTVRSDSNGVSITTQ